MRPNRDGKAMVPGKGGYDSEIVEVTGPPDRMMPMPPAKSRGKLIPLGGGEDLPYRPRPGAFLRKRVPLVPTPEEVKALPRWARVAFAARCARRVVAAFSVDWKHAPEQYLRAVEDAVRAAERMIDRPSAGASVVHAADDAAKAAPFRSVAACVAHAAADSAAYAARGATADAIDAVAHAARVIFETATLDTPLTAQLRCIRRDFARLKRLAREQKWTDDTPVPPEVFGRMWAEGVTPYWVVEVPPAPVTE